VKVDRSPERGRGLLTDMRWHGEREGSSGYMIFIILIVFMTVGYFGQYLIN